jgi:hypothetical protein
MATRKELIAAIGIRYRASARVARPKILDEFVGLTGYHQARDSGSDAGTPVSPDDHASASTMRRSDRRSSLSGKPVTEPAARLKAAILILIGAMSARRQARREVRQDS